MQKYPAEFPTIDGEPRTYVCIYNNLSILSAAGRVFSQNHIPG